MRFAIRDDDTNHFTRTEDLDRVYGPIWDRHPVSMAVVPFHGRTATGAIPRGFRSGRGSYPLHENRALVRYLRQNIRRRHISILLHGFDHVDRNGMPEFASLDEHECLSRIIRGRDYLQDLLETRVNTFVPPHNSLSRPGLAALTRVPMNVLGTFSFRPSHRPLTRSTVRSLLQRNAFLLRETFAGRRIGFYPYPLEVDGHHEMACHNLNRDPACTLRDLITRLELTLRLSGDFCLATHHWELKGPPLSQWLRALLERASALGARFVHTDEILDDPAFPAGTGVFH